MGHYTVGGRVAGTQDGNLRLHLPACYRSKAGRARIGCDEMPDDSKEVVQALMSFLSGKLSEEDMAVVGKIMSGDAAEADVPANGVSGTGALATDKRAPRRYAPVTRDRPTAFAKDATSHIRVLDSVIAQDRQPRITGEQERGFFERYPEAARIKHLAR